VKQRVLFCMFRVSVAALLLVVDLGSGQARQIEPVPRAITEVLTKQQDAWNRGDLAAFMEGYWNSPEVTFAGSSGITRGWQPVMERYQKNYPDKKAMGHLEFSDLQVHALGENTALVLGRWHLKRDSDELGGVFTLVFERFPEGWRIIHDHTSRDAKAQ
jgi:L-asparaginase / beta-aspartyl-peptidase